MKITIDLSKWYARGNPFAVIPKDPNYSAVLLERISQRRCCLGFCASQRGVPDLLLAYTVTPAYLVNERVVPEGQLGWLVTRGKDSSLAELAMEVNDQRTPSMQNLDFFDRMGFLVTIFAEGGDELEFVTGEPEPAETK